MPYLDREKAKANTREYNQKNRDRMLKAVKERTAQNPEARREYAAGYYQLNKETINAKAGKYYEQNRTERLKKNAAYRAKNKDKQRRFSLRWHYNITPEDWDQLFDKQGRKCRLCRAEKSGDKRGRGFHTDHCHTTGRVRGILCVKCNLMLGSARDNIAVLEAAIQYLKESEEAT